MIFASIQKTFWPENKVCRCFCKTPRSTSKDPNCDVHSWGQLHKKTGGKLCSPDILIWLTLKVSVFLLWFSIIVLKRRRSQYLQSERIFVQQRMLQHKVVSWGYTNARLNQMILLSPKTLELLSKIDLIKWRSRFLKKHQPWDRRPAVLHRKCQNILWILSVLSGFKSHNNWTVIATIKRTRRSSRVPRQALFG